MMTDERATAALIGGVALLERAMNYTLGSLLLVTPQAMPNPTPCREWDLRALLAHMNDSLRALHEAIEIGHVALTVPADSVNAAVDPAVDPVAALRNRGCRMMGAWANAGNPDAISVGGLPLTGGLVTTTGAVEIAVHGWDVAQACGHDRPIPLRLAEELLELATLFVTEADRPARFAAPVAVPPWASPGDRLIAFLGRRPPECC